MKKKFNILFVVNQVLPDLSVFREVPISVFGGWVHETINKLKYENRLNIGVLCLDKSFSQQVLENVTYYTLPKLARDKRAAKKKDIEKILKDFNPDLVHIEGTEFTLKFQVLQCFSGKKIISLQGILAGYSPYEYGEILLDDLIFSRSIRNIILGWLLFFNKKIIFNYRVKREIQTIRQAKFILGRTIWDRAHAFNINPAATYFHCPRILRPIFYSHSKWTLNSVNKYSVFIGNAQSPRKGAHNVIQAIAQLKAKYPTIQLKIAGTLPRAKKIFDWKKQFGYSAYLLRLIKYYKLEASVQFLGLLDQEEMADQICRSHVYVLSSIIENSPNTLGESMILGCPCVISYNGGVQSMARDEIEGLYYRSNDAAMLAYQIHRIFNSDDLANQLSLAAQRKAEITHDPKKNNKLLLDSYMKILNDEF